MKAIGTKEIKTQRLILRPFRFTDAEAMFNNWASDDEVTKFLTWPPHSDISVTKSVLTDWIDSYSDLNFYQWAICIKDDSENPIGSITVVDSNEDISEVTIGYCLGRSWWNKGIMTESLNAVIQFLFTEAEVNRIQSRHDVNNPNSGLVMKKCDMKFEGILRSSERNNQGIIDSAYYSILRHEYFEDDK